jgi:hypothetical protein
MRAREKGERVSGKGKIRRKRHKPGLKTGT